MWEAILGDEAQGATQIQFLDEGGTVHATVDATSVGSRVRGSVPASFLNFRGGLSQEGLAIRRATCLPQNHTVEIKLTTNNSNGVPVSGSGHLSSTTSSAAHWMLWVLLALLAGLAVWHTLVLKRRGKSTT